MTIHDEELERRRACERRHPSSILRAPDEEARQRETELFIADLKIVAKFLKDRQ